MTANELDPLPIGGMAGQGGSISSAAPSNSPGGAADLDLDAIEARANAATVGPWHRIYDRVITADYDDEADPDYYASMQRRCTVAKTHPFEMRISRDPRHIADAAFIANARTDVPALIAEVRALRAEVAVLNAETRARCERIRAALDRK